MTLSELQEAVGKWAEYNFPQAKPHHSFLGVVEEVGELSHAHLKMEQGIRGTILELRAEADDAIGDIMIYLAHYCYMNGYSLQACVDKAWAQVEKRDWRRFPKDGGVPGDTIGKHRQGSGT